MASVSTGPQQSDPPSSILQRVLENQLEFQAAKLARFARVVSGNVRDIAYDIEERQPAIPAVRVGGSLGSSIDRAADYLTGTSGGQMIADLDAFGRERPAGAALLVAGLGFLAARVAKVSSLQRSEHALE